MQRSSTASVIKLDSKEQVCNILLTHGDEATRYLVKHILKSAGYRRIAAVASGRDTIDRLLHGRFDLLIAGIDLPDVDVWKLMRMVRSGQFCPGALPAVIVCREEHIRFVELPAREYSAYLLSLHDIAHLPEVVTLCIEDYARIKPTVLVIEDDEKAARLTELSLQNTYNVEVAADGETGLAAWQARQHDLVLLDVMLPRLAGPAVLQRMREAKPTQTVIIITAYATRERHQDLMLAGAAEFIAKPFDIHQLRRLCENTLRSNAYLSQCAQVQQEDMIRNEVNKRLQAADYCLNTGQTGMAAHHIKRALIVNHEPPPTDDDWERLFGEFD